MIATVLDRAAHDDVTEDLAPPAENTSVAPPRRRWRLRVALLLVAILAVTSVTGWRQTSALEADQRERREVATAASQFAEALLTYDAADLHGARDGVVARATERFAAEYNTAFDAALGPAITELGAASDATVQRVLVDEVIDGTASAIVIVDSTVSSTAGSRTTTGSYLDLGLVREDGRWLVDTVISVAAIDQAPAGSTDPAGG